MLFACALFLMGYLISMTYTSVFYHRALCHGALTLSPWMLRFVGWTGMPLTGIDPKGWICMHRLHHEHSDTVKDPHSPTHTGLWYTFIKQHHSFQRVLAHLVLNNPKYTSVVSDIPFEVHWLNRKQLWWIPFVAHALIGVIISHFTSNAFAGAAYFLGICGHPVQGFLVNAFGHSKGYRNYNLSDHSTNNTWVALTCFGEGYQNNHHRFPASAKFSVKPFEFDLGYRVSILFSKLGALKFNTEKATILPAVEHVTEPQLYRHP